MPSSACDWSSDVCSSDRSEEHTSELQSRSDLVCRLLLETKDQTCALPIYSSHKQKTAYEIYTLSLHYALPIYCSHDQISYALFCLYLSTIRRTLRSTRVQTSSRLPW